MNTIAIAIPVFRTKPEWFEEISIKQAIKILNHYDHMLVVPAGLDVSVAKSWFAAAGKSVSVVEFDQAYFQHPQSYNRLMLMEDFYRKFPNYDYVLIHQTDAYVFRDDLDYWTSMGYDYVGAPWINWIHSSYQAKRLSWPTRIQWRLGRRRFDAVGNGGFSLRRVSKMLALLSSLQHEAATYHLNEDFFFAFEVKRLGYDIQIPGVQESLAFAFDENPETAFEMSGKKWPMACHAWPRYKSFWQQFIPSIGATQSL